MKKINRLLLIFIFITVTIIFDQVTKVIARKSLIGKPALHYLDDFIVIVYMENKGAFLSLGSTLPDEVRFLIFSLLVSLMLGYWLWSMIKDKDMDLNHTFATSIIVGGGIGNLIDRIFRGSVTDFVNMGFGSLRTGVFNVADIAVTTGAILLLLLALKPKLKKTT